MLSSVYEVLVFTIKPNHQTIVFFNSTKLHTHEVIYCSIVCNYKTRSHPRARPKCLSPPARPRSRVCGEGEDVSSHRGHTAERRGRPCTRISRVPKRDVRNSNNICVSVQKRSPERAHQKLASGVTAHSLVRASSRVHALHAPSMRQAGTQSGLRARRGTDGGTCRCTCGVPVHAQRVAAPFLILCRRETHLQSVVTGHTALLAHFMASASLS